MSEDHFLLNPEKRPMPAASIRIQFRHPKSIAPPHLNDQNKATLEGHA